MILNIYVYNLFKLIIIWRINNDYLYELLVINNDILLII